MKSLTTIFMGCFFMCVSFAQEKPEYILEFIDLQEKFEAQKTELKLLESKLDSLKNREDFFTNNSLLNSLEKGVNRIQEMYAKLYFYHANYEVMYNYYTKVKGVDEKQLLAYAIPKQTLAIDMVGQKPSEPKVYYYFGGDIVIEESDQLFNNEKANLIIGDVLSKESEAYLGDIIIPQNEQLLKAERINSIKLKELEKLLNGIRVGENRKTKKDSINSLRISLKKNDSSAYGIKDLNLNSFDNRLINLKLSSDEKAANYTEIANFYFKNIKIKINQGLVYDIKLLVHDTLGNEVLFENKKPISLNSFTSLANDQNLFYKSIISNNVDIAVNAKNFDGFKIKVSDVLMYIPNPGQNYVPDDFTISLPTQQSENQEQSAKYKVNQNTSLQNVLELRSYTDFLSLFGDSPNGIVQLEGTADFFIFPSLIRKSLFFPLRKITPFVNFSRLDDDTRNIETFPTKNLTSKGDSIQTFNALDLVEKSYLSMGAKLNVLSYTPKKEDPFILSLYAPIRYRIANIKVKNQSENYQTLGVGGGFMFEINRFNNFGFDFSTELSVYNLVNFNDFESIQNPKNLWLWRNEAEVYYYANKSKTQSIFLRFRTFNDSTDSVDDVFFQLQFGYKFAVGLSKLKN